MTDTLEMMPLQTITPIDDRRYTVEQYHRLIEDGSLTTDDRVELLEGRLVKKMSKSTPHEYALKKLIKMLTAMLPADWHMGGQSPITVGTSEPEPDISIVRGTEEDYLPRHPGPADIGLLVEVSASSLAIDRFDKLRIYARAGVPAYWVVNLVDRQVEVYTLPTGPVANPEYASRQTFTAGDSVPVVLDGNTLGQIAVSAVLPAA